MLFGLIGGFMAVSAFHPAFQWVAVVFGLVNVLVFIALGLLGFVCVGLVLTRPK